MFDEFSVSHSLSHLNVIILLQSVMLSVFLSCSFLKCLFFAPMDSLSVFLNKGFLIKESLIRSYYVTGAFALHN